MKLSVIAVAVLICVTGNVQAFETGGRAGIGLKGGINTYYGDIKKPTYEKYGDISLYGWVSDYWGLKLRGGIGLLKADDGIINFKTWTYTFGPMVMYKPFPKNPLNPYLTAGFELMHIDPRYSTGQEGVLPNNQADKYNNLQWAIPMGLGFSVFLGEYVSLDIEALYHQSCTDYLDDVEEGNWKDSFISASLGFSFYLSGPPDTDGDGIIDKLDKDPIRPEDKDSFQDSDGAPDYDNDNDGIPDGRDKAPNDPEDKDGFQDSDGVPDPDNDGDGVTDINDKCPGTDQNISDSLQIKEDLDGFEDEDGCPDPDNDGDGITDKNDKCPNEAETFNQYQDEDGCPDKKPEIVVEKGKSIVLEGIFFSSGSAQLDPTSLVTLDKVLRTMSENTELEVEIRGYTDNTGKYQKNVTLSKSRAESVKNYLVSKGITSYRILTKGFGPEDPVAPNTTKEGRSKNRRIEFFRIK